MSQSDWKQRLAVGAIEGEREAGLGDLDHGRNVAAGAPEGDEVGLGREVVVPDVVMHGLEVPDPLSGAGVERPQVVSRGGEDARARAVGRAPVRDAAVARLRGAAVRRRVEAPALGARRGV